MEAKELTSPPTHRAIQTTLTWVVLVDAAALGLVSWLYVRRVLSIYSILLIVAVMCAGTFVVAWRVALRRGPVVGIRVSKLAWLGVAAYTLAAIGALINWVVQPSIRSGVQALVGICLAGCVWWIVRVVKKMQLRNSQ